MKIYEGKKLKNYVLGQEQNGLKRVKNHQSISLIWNPEIIHAKYQWLKERMVHVLAHRQKLYIKKNTFYEKLQRESFESFTIQEKLI